MEERTLDQLAEGEAARVAALGHSGAMRRRLLDIGLIPGTAVGCIQKSRGGMTAYFIRGAVIALRREDARLITLQQT